VRDRVLAWAREAAGGRDVPTVAGAADLESLLAGHDGPVMVVAPDVPGVGAHHTRAAREDIADGVLLTSAPATDGKPFLVALARPEPRLLPLIGQPFDVVYATAHELGGDFGMLRPERRLASLDDARALRADPLAPRELRDLLSDLA
jgi:hypothetical protein